MEKTFKWSVLLTIVIGIVWIFMPENLKMSPTFKYVLFNYDICSSVSISRYFDLVAFVILPVTIAGYLKNDDSFESVFLAIILVSCISLMAVLFCNFEDLERILCSIIFILSIIICAIAIQDLPDLERPKFIFKRLFASFLTVIIVNTLLWGVWNGLMIAGYFLLSFTVIVFLSMIAGFLWGVAVKTPSAVKSFFAWMNK